MAEDSNDSKEQPQTDEKPSGSTSMMVPNSRGEGTREIQRAPSGRFAKNPKPLPPAIEFTRAERKALLQAAEGGLNEYMKCFMNIVRIAQYSGDDAKCMGAAVKAFETLRKSALGDYARSEQEIDALKVNGPQVILINAPELMHPEIQEKKKAEKTQPSFIDAEVVSDKK